MRNIEEYLKQFWTATKEPTLDAMWFFMERLGNPHIAFKTIHVAGTNGKGSVVQALGSVLKEAGYKVGKFISPYLVKFNEYMSIDNSDISDDELEELLSILKPLIDEYQADHNQIKQFEIATTLALMYFAKHKVDIAIIEVGIESEWDCTNIITPEISIITKVDFDHMDLLGNTIEDMARNNSGIIKEGIPVITCDSNTVRVLDIIKEAAKRKGANVTVTKKTNLPTSLKGSFQQDNMGLVIQAAKILGIDKAYIKEGLMSVRHAGRFETLCESPLIIFDGAHNPDSLRAFVQMVNEYFGNSYPKRFVISMISTKDIVASAQILRQLNGELIFTNGVNEKFHRFNDGIEFKDAILASTKDKITFIIGSFYTYAKARQLLKDSGICSGDSED